MKVKYAVAMMLGASVWAGGVGAQQIQINKENKTIAITTSDQAEAMADTAVLTVGFHLYGKDQDGTYADASKTSNAVMAAIKAAGVPKESAGAKRRYGQSTLCAGDSVRVFAELACDRTRRGCGKRPARCDYGWCERQWRHRVGVEEG
jgi:hypothetical protein